MNTYRNRRKGNPWAGVKPARTVTQDEAELCCRQAWERFVLYRMADASIETLREIHASLTAPKAEEKP